MHFILKLLAKSVFMHYSRTLNWVGIKCEKSLTDEKLRKDAKRAEKMEKGQSLMRKQALLSKNKVFFKREYI